MLFKFLRKLLGIEENRFEPRILAGKYKPRIYKPDAYKVDDDIFISKTTREMLDPSYFHLPCNIFYDD